MSWIIYLLIGLGAGLLSGVFGIGGGVVIVPALIFLGRMQMQTATGTSLAALLLPVGALGALAYYRAGHLDAQAAVLVALGLFLGAGGGARLALLLPASTLRRAFAVLLALLAVRMWFAPPSPAADHARAHGESHGS
jgi:uncharacterized membrane protein YfcA